MVQLYGGAPTEMIGEVSGDKITKNGVREQMNTIKCLLKF